jgi:hypothetical protein
MFNHYVFFSSRKYLKITWNLFFPLFFFVLQRAFFYFLCTVSGCDGGNRTRNIAVYTWRYIAVYTWRCIAVHTWRQVLWNLYIYIKKQTCRNSKPGCGSGDDISALATSLIISPSREMLLRRNFITCTLVLSSSRESLRPTRRIRGDNRLLFRTQQEIFKIFFLL